MRRLHGLGAEQVAGEGPGVEEDRGERVAQRAAEPAVEGDAEAHLGAGEDLGGDQVGEGGFQDDLGPAAAEAKFVVDGQRQGQLDDAVVEERAPGFERVRHARLIDLDQEVAGQIRQEVGHGGAGDGVASGGGAQGFEQDGGGVGGGARARWSRKSGE